MRFFFTLLVLVLTTTAEGAGAGQTMTLEQCLHAGMKNNPALQASRFRADAAGQDIKAARSDFLPSLSSSYSASRIENTAATGPADTDYISQNIQAYNVKLSQILYAGSRLVNTYEKAQFMEQARQAEMHLAKLELAYNIETTFYKVMKAQQDVIMTTGSIKRLSASVKAAEAFSQKQLVPYVDVLKARVDLADAEDQLSIAKNNKNRQRATLFALMNLPLDATTEFSNDTFVSVPKTPSFDACLHYALAHRPDIQSLEYQRNAAQKDSKIALGKYLPLVRLDAGYYDYNKDYIDYNSSQDNNYWMAGVTVSWDLFDGGRAWHENEKYSLESQKFSALMQDARNTIATGIRNALYSLTEAKQRMDSSADALAAAEENYTMEESSLRAGVSTMTAVLDAQSRLIRAQSNKANAILDYQLAQSELKLMTGGQNKFGDN